MYKRIGLLVISAVLASSGCGGGADSQSSANPAQTLAQRAGALLFDGMGDYHMPITTADPDAQRYFDQGMVLAFGFNHAESIRSFRAAQTLDPTCAMCFWGEALATGPNINVTSNGKAIMAPAERASARAAIDQALALMDAVTPKEQDWIKALDQRYDGQADTPRDPLDRAWADAVAYMAARYPDDTTVASVYAEALMNTMPWDYWGPEGEAKPDTQAVIASLEAVMAADPDHPLALHLYIHALEASSNAAKAEPRRIGWPTLVPGSGHLVHVHLLQSRAVSGFRARQHPRSRGGRGLHRPMQCTGLLSRAVLPSQHSFPVGLCHYAGSKRFVSRQRAAGGRQCAGRAGGAVSDHSVLPHGPDALFGEVCALGGNSCRA